MNRPLTIPYKDTLELYENIPLYDLEQSYVIRPIDPSSSLPIYIILSGTHTTNMTINALALANQNTNYDTLADFQQILTLIDDIHSIANGKDIILTGYSYGGVKAIFCAVEKCDKLLKVVTFNPWVGMWASGFSSNPLNYLNQWYLDKLTELHQNYGITPIHPTFTNLYNNFVSGEFASKYLQMSATFNIEGQDKLLSLAWGINFKFQALGASAAVPKLHLHATCIADRTAGPAHR